MDEVADAGQIGRRRVTLRRRGGIHLLLLRLARRELLRRGRRRASCRLGWTGGGLWRQRRRQRRRRVGAAGRRVGRSRSCDGAGGVCRGGGVGVIVPRPFLLQEAAERRHMEARECERRGKLRWPSIQMTGIRAPAGLWSLRQKGGGGGGRRRGGAADSRSRFCACVGTMDGLVCLMAP